MARIPGTYKPEEDTALSYTINVSPFGMAALIAGLTKLLDEEGHLMEESQNKAIEGMLMDFRKIVSPPEEVYQ